MLPAQEAWRISGEALFTQVRGSGILGSPHAGSWIGPRNTPARCPKPSPGLVYADTTPVIPDDMSVPSPAVLGIWAGAMLNFAITEFSEVGPRAWPLLSGGRHRRGPAQGEPFLRGQDDRRVRALHPPQFGRRPVVDGLLNGRRLDHQLASVDQLAQALLLLEDCLQFDRSHPVEGGPNAPPLAALLLDKQPELFPAPSAQGFFLRPHEQPTFAFQAPGLQAIPFEL